MKPCVKCGATERSVNGSCKPCARAYAKKYRADNPDKAKAAQIAWREASTEKIKAYEAAYRIANRDRRNAASASYYASHKDSEKEKAAARWLKNRDEYLAKGAEWRRLNPEKARAASFRWAAANPDRVKANKTAWASRNKERISLLGAKWRRDNNDKTRLAKHNRRARIKDVGGRLSPGLADRLFTLQSGKCACGCKQPLGTDYHLDHIMPLALGGSNTDSNIQLLRASCNHKKSAKHPVDYMQSKGFLI